MSHHFATRGNKRYRYYVCIRAQKNGWSACPAPSLPAKQLEDFVVEQIKTLGRDPGAEPALDLIGDWGALIQKSLYRSMAVDSCLLLTHPF